ncbi:GGDEF domain-containing protein [Aquifex aeolicus]|uniref:GGDEF domain-containing protein n=1 Tax=Aquifex aeolicus TaxID=63363 RepID=UPI0023790885|nr:GGDEF domain-containing protein [Aquifex aeolicus]
MLIDIADFSYINKVYGYDFGDELIRKIAEILKKNFKESDIIGRIEGDLFAIFAKNLKKKENVFSLIERLKEILDKDVVFEVRGKKLHIIFHGGVSIYPDDGKTFEELLQNARIALKEAKQEGYNVVKIYNKELEKRQNLSFI